MKFPEPPKTKEHELCPPGSYAGRCYQYIDYGTHHYETQWGGKIQRKFQFGFEITGPRMKDGKPFALWQTFTMSMYHKGALLPFLTNWLGGFNEDSRPDLTQLVGRVGLVTVIHNTKGEKTYANMGAVVPMPEAMPEPEPINPQVIFDLDAPDIAVFDSLPDFMKEKIIGSNEHSAWLIQMNRGTEPDAQIIVGGDPKPFPPSSIPVTSNVIPGVEPQTAQQGMTPQEQSKRAGAFPTDDGLPF